MNARLAGFTFLFYIAVGISVMVLSGRATNAQARQRRARGFVELERRM